jgi:hypothetical protein
MICTHMMSPQTVHLYRTSKTIKDAGVVARITTQAEGRAMSVGTYNNRCYDYVKKAPSGDAKRFIKRVRELAVYRIPNEALYRAYLWTNDFSDLWSRLNGEYYDYPLQMATRFLSVHDDLRAAEELICVWWKVHKLNPDEMGLKNALKQAAEDTHELRKNWRRMAEKIKRKKALKRKLTNMKIKVRRPPKTRAEAWMRSSCKTGRLPISQTG